MATAPRQSRPQGKKPIEPTVKRAWTGARASPTFSPVSSPRPSNPPTSTQPAFPPLSQPNGARPDAPQDRTLQSLAGLTGTTVTLRTKTGQHLEGAIASTNAEGDTAGVTLRDVRDISVPGQPIKESLFIATTNISGWNSGPAHAKPPADNFRTDTEISKGGPRPNRELQAWLPTSDAPAAELNGAAGKGDDETFGSGTSGIPWDQFAANEELFGITPQFDENVYTTKLDRSGADFKERERKAQRIANEITGATSSNPHIAEERNQVIDDSGADEENKYSTVVRGTNAYIPPGARRGNANPTSPPAKADVPKVSINGPDGATVQPPHQPSPGSSKAASPAPPAAANKPPADAVPAFRDFVNHEKQRLAQKKQALVKSEIEKKIAEFKNFSVSFKLNKPIPDDLVSILAKDEAKQQSIRDKSSKDASSTEARSIGASLTNVVSRAPATKGAPPKAPAAGAKPAVTTNGAPPAANAPKPAPAASTQSSESSLTGKKLIPMVIQAIPAFKGAKKSDQVAPSASTSNTSQKPTPPNASAAAAAANRLNVDASSFRPNPKANAFSPGNGPSSSPGNASAGASPKPKEISAANPFFGSRVIKKSTPVQVKDDFNPFKTNPKLPKASLTSTTWTDYNGKRYMTIYPQQAPHPGPQQPSPHLAQHAPPPAMPPPSYEEDQAAAAQRYAPYMYSPYAYPGQPMMPGMAPPGPPGAYVPAQFMQAIPYPHGMPPPGAMYSPAMGQMPPQGYMPPPPGTYPPPPPNGAGRPSMPPTPIPAHAHPYYPHQSPQMQHAVPYPMMMPPPGAVPQHPSYEGANGPAQPVQMGGHA